jgi:hypothetical protein
VTVLADQPRSGKSITSIQAYRSIGSSESIEGRNSSK